MSRLFIEDYGRLRGRAESAHGDEPTTHAPSDASVDDGDGTPRLYRDRHDQSGRRGLTGVEFRRRRTM
jgi:hypothetical protein